MLRDAWEEPDAPGEESGPYRWRVPIVLPVLKLAGAAVCFALGLTIADGRVDRPVAIVLAVALATWGLHDLLARVRVLADDTGITVATGFAGHRRYAWSDVEAVRLDTRPRLGVRTETLEIDAGESLHLFGAYDLGASPAAVAETLEHLRTRPTT